MQKAARLFIICVALLTVMSGYALAQGQPDSDDGLDKGAEQQDRQAQKQANPAPQPMLKQTPKSDDNAKKADSLSVEQIGLSPRSTASSDFQIATQSTAKNDKALVGQLPGDLEIPEDDDSRPEAAISRPVISPEAKLYGQVAEAWQVIRQRGEQPTPELIAREIGPDTLATFLDQNPAAADIFGRDSDTLPVDIPGVDQLPDGGIEFLPPGQGK